MFSRVMLALDLSELTPRILDVFYSVCLDPETEVYLLHVVKKAEWHRTSKKPDTIKWKSCGKAIRMC